MTISEGFVPILGVYLFANGNKHPGPVFFMSMNYNVLLLKTEDQVNLLYREYANPNLHYHNRAHVQEVFDAARKIAAYYKLNDRWFFIVCAAAYFHDTSYLVARNDSHE